MVIREAFSPDDDARDGILFRLWVRLASEKPGRTARALTLCRTPADYREALMKLAAEERINLP